MGQEQQGVDAMLKHLREATRVNSPADYCPGYRLVGFLLPDEVAWPTDGTAYDILAALLTLVPASQKDSPDV